MADRFYSVFVGHIDPSTRKYDLRDLFEKCGPVADVFICPNNREGTYNFGFVRYSERAHAERAIRELHRWEVCGSAIIVQMARDTIEKLKRERAAEELFSDVSRRPARNVATTKSSLVKDSMFLARVKESATALTIQSTDAENNITHLMDDVQRCDSKKSGTQWGSISDPVTSFDHVTQKLIARSQETGEAGKLIGAKKAQEFISSLKTIMQEIEDFLGRTATLYGSEGPDNQSGAGALQDDATELLIDQCTASSDDGATSSEKVTTTQDRRDGELKLGSHNQDFSSMFIDDHRTNCIMQNLAPRAIDKHSGIDHLRSDTASVEEFCSGHFKTVANTENETITATGLDTETKEKVTTSRRVRSLDSGLYALSLTRSPIRVVGTDTDQEVTANVPNNMRKETTRSRAATFFLSESLQQEQSVNISEYSNREIQNHVEMSAATHRNTTENELVSNDIELKQAPSMEVVQRRARSLGNDLCQGATPLQKERICSLDNVPYQGIENDVMFKREDKTHSSENDIRKNTENCRETDSSVLDKLFAKLPALNVYDRSNSQDSSLSEDSFEGIEDSGVESDFRPSYSHIDPQASEQLKSLLGIKPQAIMRDVRDNPDSQSRAIKADSSLFHNMKARTSYGRGRFYNH